MTAQIIGNFYEGDLVKTHQDHEEMILKKIFNETWADYTKGSFFICQSTLGSMLFSDYTCCNHHPAALEIIGNIFETTLT